MKNNSPIRFPSFVAKRYLFSRGEPRFTSFLAAVAVCGVAVGIAALIVVISVMTGFAKDLESKLMGFNPHVTVLFPGQGSSEIAEEIKKNFSDVKDVGPFVTGEVIAQSVRGESSGAMGAKVYGVKTIPKRMFQTAKFYWGGGVEGEVWWHKIVSPLDEGVILGHEMLYQIGVYPDFEDRVHLIAPFGGIDPLGNLMPKRREYKVSGGFKSGFFEYDIKYILMPYDEAVKLLGSQGRYGLQIMLKNAHDVNGFTEKLGKFLGQSYEVSSWTAKNKKLFAALKLEKLAMTFLLFLIIVIASFSIVGVALMIFFSKRRDLAVLMAMGASQKNIEKIFLLHGGFIGLIGALSGTVIGFILCMIIARSNIVLPPSYYLDYLPVSINGWLMLVMGLGGIAISLAAAYYPAKRAAATDPVALLRYE